MVEKLASSEIAQSRERIQKLCPAYRQGGTVTAHWCVICQALEQAERDTRERLDKEWSRMFFNPYTNNRKEGRCCKCLCHCPSINEMAHHATCPVFERIRGKE